MYLSDDHLHSYFSLDGRYSIADMARAAIAAGMQEICITDHLAPQDWANGIRNTFRWEKLTQDFGAAQAELGDRIELHLGIEIGDGHRDADYSAQLFREAPEFDFVIGSVHFLSQKFNSANISYFNPADEAEIRRELDDYFDLMLDMVRWGQFSVLGHLTLPLRYFNGEMGYHITLDDREERIREIFRTLIERGRGIELNTNRGGMTLPDETWLRVYREMGGEIVTLGTDAHAAEHVALGIREGQELLRQCGFRRFCTFEKKQPVWHEL